MTEDEAVLADAEALLNEYAPEHQRPGDITVTMAMQKWHVGQRKALDKLTQMVADHKAECVKEVQLDNGRRGRVWRPVRKAKNGTTRN